MAQLFSLTLFLDYARTMYSMFLDIFAAIYFSRISCQNCKNKSLAKNKLLYSIKVQEEINANLKGFRWQAIMFAVFGCILIFGHRHQTLIA